MLEQKIMRNPATSDYEEAHRQNNGQLNRRLIQSTLLYSLDHLQTKDMRPDHISSSVQYIQKQLDKEKGWTMDPLVGPSIESLVPTNLCSAGPVYAFACNAKIITTATYFPFGNLAPGRTSEHVSICSDRAS
jgi:hypothetical protein